MKNSPNEKFYSKKKMIKLKKKTEKKPSKFFAQIIGNGVDFP
jgi:predicted peroxiredoxin